MSVVQIVKQLDCCEKEKTMENKRKPKQKVKGERGNKYICTSSTNEYA